MALLPELGAGLMTMACHEMIVDHADCLHERVDNGRPAKLEAALGEILRHGLRYFGLGRHLAPAAKAVHLRPAVDEIPQQFGEAGAFLHDLEPSACRDNGALDLRAIAHDAGVLHET